MHHSSKTWPSFKSTPFRSTKPPVGGAKKVAQPPGQKKTIQMAARCDESIRRSPCMSLFIAVSRKTSKKWFFKSLKINRAHKTKKLQRNQIKLEKPKKTEHLSKRTPCDGAGTHTIIDFMYACMEYLYACEISCMHEYSKQQTLSYIA